MKGNCNYQPPAFIPYGNTGAGQVLFLVERNDKTNDDGIVTESWDYEMAVAPSPDRDSIITAIIRERYPADAVEAIINNHLTGDDTGEFAQLQSWRSLAKAVAGGKYLKTDLQEILSAEVSSRLIELEDATSSIIQVLNDKGVAP
jgi:hypothetical protein